MRRAVTLALCCALAAGLVLLWGFSRAGEATPAQAAPRTLLLVENDTGAYLMQLRKGLQGAVQQRGGTLSVERLNGLGLDGLPPTPAEVDTVYLFAPRKAADVTTALHQQGYTVMVVEQSLRGEICVLPDDLDGGRQAGEFVRELTPQGPVTVVADAGDARQALRLEGVLSALDDVSYTLLTPSQTGGIDANTACLLVLDDAALATMAQRKAQGLLPGDLPLVGFGRGEAAVPLMEQGLLQGLVADDPYALGYMAGALLDSLRTGELKPSLHLVPQRLVTPDTLYDPENVKLMFPLLD